MTEGGRIEEWKTFRRPDNEREEEWKFEGRMEIRTANNKWGMIFKMVKQ